MSCAAGFRTRREAEAAVAGMGDELRQGTSVSETKTTVKEVHTILHKAFHDAVNWGRLGRNPADLADLPAARSPDIQVWSAEQLRKFLKSVESDRLYAIWLWLM